MVDGSSGGGVAEVGGSGQSGREGGTCNGKCIWVFLRVFIRNDVGNVLHVVSTGPIFQVP